MMKTERFEQRAAELRQRMTATKTAPALVIAKSGSTVVEPMVNLQEAARRIGVSYTTAARILANEPGVRRFSTTPLGEVIYPDTLPKRGRRVRFTYIVPVTVVERVIRRMGVNSMAS